MLLQLLASPADGQSSPVGDPTGTPPILSKVEDYSQGTLQERSTPLLLAPTDRMFYFLFYFIFLPRRLEVGWE